MDNALDFQYLSKLVLDFLIFGDSIASWSSIWFLFRVMNNALDFIPQIHLYIFSFFEINIDLRLKDSSLWLISRFLVFDLSHLCDFIPSLHHTFLFQFLKFPLIRFSNHSQISIILPFKSRLYIYIYKSSTNHSSFSCLRDF